MNYPQMKRDVEHAIDMAVKRLDHASSDEIYDGMVAAGVVERLANYTVRVALHRKDTGH